MGKVSGVEGPASSRRMKGTSIASVGNGLVAAPRPIGSRVGNARKQSPGSTKRGTDVLGYPQGETPLGRSTVRLSPTPDR